MWSTTDCLGRDPARHGDAAADTACSALDIISEGCFPEGIPARFSASLLIVDWFFVKGLAKDPRTPGGNYQFAPHFGRTLVEVNDAPEEPLSDHFPLTVDLPLTEPKPLNSKTR